MTNDEGISAQNSSFVLRLSSNCGERWAIKPNPIERPQCPKLESNIKLIYAVAANTLVNQYGNINRTVEILRDENLVEFID